MAVPRWAPSHGSSLRFALILEYSISFAKKRVADAFGYQTLINDVLAQVMGVYPLLPDETCWFLAIDFDNLTKGKR